MRCRAAFFLAVLWLLGASAAEARKRPRCPGGNFAVSAEQAPLFPSPTPADIVSVDDSGGDATVEVWSGCGETSARLKRRRRGTNLVARWGECEGIEGPVKLKARIDGDACELLHGRLTAKKEKMRRTFSATRAEGTVGGTLAVADSAIADLDTADPTMDGENDSIATAQPVRLLSTIGGAAYIRTVNLFDDDFYRIELGGEPVAITLAIADPTVADLDLFLVDAAGNDIVPPSRGTSNVEQLTTTDQTGEAFIVVSTNLADDTTVNDGGWTGYVLSIGQTVLPGIVPSEAEIVPGEVVAKMRPSSSLGVMRQLAADADPLSFVSGDPAGERASLYRLDGMDDGGVLRALAEPARPFGSAAGKVKRLADLSDRDRTLAAVEAMRRNPDCEWAEPNVVARPFAEPNDEFYHFQWHYPLISLPEAWDLTTGSPEVVMAIVDTGVLYDATGGLASHPDLDPARFVPGYDFIRDVDNARDGDGIDGNPYDDGDGRRGVSSSFHGSHVLGTLAGHSNNGVGVAAVDWQARIMPLRALGVDGGTTYDIAQAIRFAAGLANDSGTLPAQRADVINLSLGAPGYSGEMHSAIREARARGVVVVVAAGNERRDAQGFSPAQFAEVVTVSAADLGAGRTAYTNFGAAVDVAAPGGDTSEDRNGDGFADGVLSTGGDDAEGSVEFRYPFFQGTSMATPHVAGVVALMQAAYLGATEGERFLPEDLDGWLADGDLSDDLGTAGFGWAGAGLINARKAVERAGGAGGPLPPTLGVSPRSVSFGSDLDSVTLTIANRGTGMVTVESVTASEEASWLGIELETPLPAVAPMTITLHGNREGLPAGTVQQAAVVIDSDVGSRTVPVALHVPVAGTGGDVGTVYVLLVDEQTRATRYQLTTAASLGYAVDFPEPIAAGRYLLAAGTDRDGDRFIGDAGEAFGAWPDLTDKPGVVVVENGAELDLSFPLAEAISVAASGVDSTAGTARVELELRDE
jgi:serine protease